jgi:UDP-glucose 4-epimerase
MRYLVTGGCGSIGSEIARQLVARGDEVVIIDNLSGGSEENISDIRDKVLLYVNDVLAVPVIDHLVQNVDAVFHMAASLGVKLILEKPIETMYNNVEGTRRVLNACSLRKTPVVVASTSEVYGLSDRIPFNEEDPITLGASSKSRWSYANSKLQDEFMALAYMQERGVPAVVTRFFNCTGRQQSSRYGMVVPTFVKQALAGEPITVYGTGEQSRCFADVRDTAKATIALLDNKAFGKVVNVGSQSEITIAGLAKLVKSLTNSNSEIQYIPYAQAYSEGFEDMPRRVPSLNRLRELAGFVPSTPLEETIQRTAEWMVVRQAYKIGDSLSALSAS